MGYRHMLIIILCVLLSCVFCGCTTNGSADTEPVYTTTCTTTAPTEETAPETEARMPVISKDSISLYYDDYFDLSQISEGKITVEITDQQVTSKIVGSQDADNAVIYYHKDKNCLIAVGTGTATVTVNDISYQVTVTSAPISLFMITGHSIGAGQTGVAAQSVLCADGQAYSMYGVKNVEDYVSGTGIGFAAPQKPKGIAAFSSTGEGTIGEGSALAWNWNNLTGEKVWVLNAAVGGTCLSEWIKGAEAYENAVKLFQYAQNVLTAEIAAGHYRLKDMGIIYHSAANFAYKNVVYTDESGQQWYDSMWSGFKADLAMDMNGDGAKETVQALGLVPIWNNLTVGSDKPANYAMAASDAYKDIFMASAAGKSWLKKEGLEKDFPEINYQTHGEAVTKPADPMYLFSDGVHYVQSAYNALGLDIANNLFAFFRKVEAPVSLQLVQTDSNKVYDHVELKLEKKLQLIPYVEPITVNDLTFSVTDNLELSYPCVITAKVVGTGTLTISYKGEVLQTIIIDVKD